MFQNPVNALSGTKIIQGLDNFTLDVIYALPLQKIRIMKFFTKDFPSQIF